MTEDTEKLIAEIRKHRWIRRDKLKVSQIAIDHSAGGGRLLGIFPCPQCGTDRLTQKRYRYKICKPCAGKNRKRKYSAEEVETLSTYMKEDADANSILLRDIVVEAFGGSCQVCHISFPACVYEFHHLDPDKKDAHPAELFRQSDVEKIKAELEGCVMVCANCHRRVHWGDLELNGA